MEPFVLVPDSLYNNKNLYTQAVTKQELPKYQAEQNPMQQNDSFKKEKFEKLFTKSDTLVSEVCLQLLISFQIHKKNWIF